MQVSRCHLQTPRPKLAIESAIDMIASEEQRLMATVLPYSARHLCIKPFSHAHTPHKKAARRAEVTGRPMAWAFCGITMALCLPGAMRAYAFFQHNRGGVC